MDETAAQKLGRNFVDVGRRFVFRRQKRQKAEAGHEGVEAGTVAAAGITIPVLTV